MGKSILLLPRATILLLLLVLVVVVEVSSGSSSAAAAAEEEEEEEEEEEDPTPTAWPEQFHSILYVNYSGALSLIDLWYDWPNGRNFNIIQDQLGTLLYDLEWTNGTSFFYTLDASSPECSSAQLPVGILRPNWLDGATYLGQRLVDGFLCNVWEKVDFIWYYEDVVSKRPVHWTFYTGRSIHVMTFEVGAVLEDAKWQAPIYCFEEKMKEDDDVNDVKSNSNSNSNSILPIISDWRRLSQLSHSEPTPTTPAFIYS